MDKRVAHRYITEGRITQADWDDHLKGLEDNVGQSEAIQFRPGEETRPPDSEPEPDVDDSLDI